MIIQHLLLTIPTEHALGFKSLPCYNNKVVFTPASMNKDLPNTKGSPADSRVVEHRGVTWRSLLVGVIVAVLNAYWIQQVEGLRGMLCVTYISLLMNAVFTLLFLSLLNLLLRCVAPKFALSQPELLLIYSMACLGSVGASKGFNQFLVPVMTWSFQMANPANNWNALFNNDLPTWLTVRDPHALRGLYEGGTTLYRPDLLAAWILPIAMWVAFAAAVVLVMVCINVLIRKQWLDNEHLACPLVNLPIEIAQPRRLFSHKLLWIGFGLAAALDIWNSFAVVYPALPAIPINCVDMAGGLQARPWNAVGFMPRAFYPMVIGIGYLMPSDFLFSCWFFYLFWKAEAVVGAAFGLDQIRGFPFVDFQGYGAYVLFGVYALWLGRRHLRDIYDTILGLPSRLNDEQEPVRYRVAALGIAVGMGFLVWFSLRIGMQVWLALAFFLIYYLLAVAVTRVRAQFGAPIHDIRRPHLLLTAVLGSRAIPKKDLIGLAMYFWFAYDYRSLPMAHQIEGLKMQDYTTNIRRGLVPILTMATVLGFVVAVWTCLDYNYKLGGAGEGYIREGDWIYNQLGAWLRVPEGTRWGPVSGMVVGVMVAFFLQTMRLRFLNWPFHPLGFALAGGFEMNVVWLQLLIAWLIKTSVIKFGGHKIYRRLIPFFLGLILGQCVVGSIASTIGLIMREPIYKFLSMQ